VLRAVGADEVTGDHLGVLAVSLPDLRRECAQQLLRSGDQDQPRAAARQLQCERPAQALGCARDECGDAAIVGFHQFLRLLRDLKY
jgi:hypothetical protein